MTIHRMLRGTALQLMASFLAGSNTPQGSWTVIGLGIRMAQDIGIHRKKMYSTKPTVIDELWKRAFWCAVRSRST